MKSLPSHRLILNGNRIHTTQQLFAYIQKRTGTDIRIQDVQDMQTVLGNYDTLRVAIWHSEHFLEGENLQKREMIIHALMEDREFKMT